VIKILGPYFFLPDGKVLVKGAKYSILADFEKKEIYRINASAMHIIECGEKGYTLDEALTVRGSENPDILRFIEELKNQGIISLSSEPKPDTFPDKPAIGLEFMWIEVTMGCNLHCPHCYVDAGAKRVVDPPKEEIYDWLEQGAQLGCKKVQFTGGECTMRKDLESLIRYAKKTGFDFIEVMTNCTFITEHRARFFARHGIHVATSLYSYRPSTHDAITGVPGSCAKTIHGIQLLLAHEVPVRCDIVAMSHNEEDLEGTVRFLKEMGIYRRPPIPIRPTGRGVETKHWSRTCEFQSIRSRHDDFPVDREMYELSLCWNNCWAGLIAITPEGTILPCIFAREQVAGNVRTQPLSDIIHGPMQEFWRLTKDHVEVCRDCEYRYFCLDCRPWAYGYSGNLSAKSPRCTYDPYTGIWGPPEGILNPDNIDKFS
jgi:radical SAM protein with 4Fe4S-binding SPASM domain